MDLEELLEKLDLESPSELIYFEQFADLIEDPSDIPLETLLSLTDAMEPAIIAELVGGYFEDVLSAIPENEDDLYTLFYNIDTTLETLAGSGEDETMQLFAEEFYRFRSWYMFEPCVRCSNVLDGSEQEITLFEAITNYRAKNYTDDDLVYDFTDALNFQLDEYIISIGSMYDDDFDDDDLDEDPDDDDYIEPDKDD